MLYILDTQENMSSIESKFMNNYLDARFTKGKSTKRTTKRTNRTTNRTSIHVVLVDTKKAQKKCERLAKRAKSNLCSIVDQEYSTNMHKKAVIIGVDPLIETDDLENRMYNDHGAYVDLSIDFGYDYGNWDYMTDLDDDYFDDYFDGNFDDTEHWVFCECEICKPDEKEMN